MNIVAHLAETKGSLDYHTYKVHGVQTEKETLHKRIHAVHEGKKTYEKVANHIKIWPLHIDIKKVLQNLRIVKFV